MWYNLCLSNVAAMDNHSSSLVNHLQTGNSYHSYVRYGEWEYITENLVNGFVDIVRMYFFSVFLHWCTVVNHMFYPFWAWGGIDSPHTRLIWLKPNKYGKTRAWDYFSVDTLQSLVSLLLRMAQIIYSSCQFHFQPCFGSGETSSDPYWRNSNTDYWWLWYIVSWGARW